MKRDIRDYVKNTQASPQSSAASDASLKSAAEAAMAGNPSMMEDVKQAVDHYGGKSEAELMEELLRYRGTGAIDDASLARIATQIGPMLNAEQQRKLESVMRRLKS